MSQTQSNVSVQNHHKTPPKQQQQQQQPKSKSSQQQQQQTDSDPWVCVLCRKICHYKGIGDLYGPYTIDLSDSNNNNNSNNSNNPERCKNVTPKKSKYSLLNHNYARKEVWIHEDCLIWSEGVHLVGKKILKMDEIIKASFNHNCSICKTKGATLGCIGKRCRRKFHYTCARDTGNCLLDEANFSLKCDKCLSNTAANLSLSVNL